MSLISSHPTAYAVFVSVAAGLVYASVWRLPFHYPIRSRSLQIFTGICAAIAMLFLFGWAQPRLILLPFSADSSGLTFLRADFWMLALLGFMQGLFCLLPLASWFDEQTYNSPLFKKKHPFGLALSALLFVVVPHCLALNAYTHFGNDRMEYISYWSPGVRYLEYGDVAEFHLDSESRTRRGNKGGVRRYYVLRLELGLKNQSGSTNRWLILETEDPDEALAGKTALLIRFLEGRGIPADVPFVLIGMEKWKSRLDYHLQKR